MFESAFMETDDGQKKVAENQEEFFREQATERWEYCCLIARVFDTDEGKKLLDNWLEVIAGERLSLQRAVASGVDVANIEGWYREGQANFVEDIRKSIDIAKSSKDLDEFCSKIRQLDSKLI